MRAIQDVLITAPTLVSDDDKCQPDLKTDANKHDKGVVLSRVDRQDKRRIIFIIRGTTKAEQNYSSNELECNALVWAFKKFCHHLYVCRFMVWTDNMVLRKCDVALLPMSCRVPIVN